MKKGRVRGDVNGMGIGVRWYYNSSSQETRQEDQYLKASLGYLGVKKRMGKSSYGGNTSSETGMNL